MKLPGSPSRFLLPGAALLAGLSACSSSDDLRNTRNLTAGDTYALTAENRLVSFNRAFPALVRTDVAITGLNAGEELLGIDFRPSNRTLYGLTSDARIVSIATDTGAATVISTLVADPADASPSPNNAAFGGLSGTEFGVDFNPVPDRLRVVSDTGQNLRINVETGATITDGNLAQGGAPATNITAAAYTNSFGAACRTSLFYLDTTTNTLLGTSAPNDGTVTTVGPLGASASSGVSAFEIITAANGANSAFAVLATAGGPTLYIVNTTTGAATAVAAIGGASYAASSIRGLAMVPPASPPAQAAGELFGLTPSGRLVSFNRSAPAKLCTNAAVTNVGAGETLQGIDFRPATGALYALSSDGSNTGRLYTLDTGTGAATLASTLVVDPADATAPYTALSGTVFGVDFNPVPDRLRVITGNGQNLRINVETGLTTTDGDLNGGAMSASAAAYTNSLAGAGTTTLYSVDTATDTLYTQNPPNNGTLVNPLPLGVDLSTANGFDIDGRDNVALLAGAVEGVTPATNSTLYTVNLTSGAATALGAIGNGSGLAEPLQGLARPTPTVSLFGLRSGTELVRLSMSDPAAVTSIGAVSGLGSETLVGIDFRPSNGQLHGVGSGGSLFVIDPVTAVATSVALSTAPDVVATAFGVDFNPVPNALRIVSNTGQNLRVANAMGTPATTPLSGNTIVDGSLNRLLADSSFSIGAVGYTDSLGAPMSTTLYGLDATADRLVAINPPNSGVVRVIGPVGVDVLATSTLEIIGPVTAAGTAGTAVAVFDTVGTKLLYDVNLATGLSTSLGAIGTADPILGLAAEITTMVPAINSRLFAVAGANLISFARNAPGTLSSSTAITGIGVGETVAGIDFRTASGALWMLTRDAVNVGRLYTLNTGTGLATPVSTVSVALSGTSFAVDFNPVPDRLRVVSDSGQNLRINVDTGAATVDGSINQPAPTVHAAAYINNVFPAPMTTELYVIDAAVGSLLRQDPPNAGVLNNIGALSAAGSFSSVSGFDIAGGANGVVLATLQPVATPVETASRLYRVNLLTGTATEVVPGALVGGAGSATISGLAIRVQ